ncbi:phosphatidylserine decarboxylase [Segnochrobactraceae bacterium EtOH-i3]
MNIVQSIRDSMIVPIHKEGHLFIVISALVTAILIMVAWPLFVIGLIITVWMIYFFRDPPRLTPIDDSLVISPADGHVSSIGPAAPPPELGLPEGNWVRISVFMNVFDCHVNRAPLPGTITKIAYKPGKFLSADLDKASEQNERNGFLLETVHGPVGVVQIAGLVARRIVAFSKEGQRVEAGERIGMIRFGSRVDVYLPEGTGLKVGVGQTAIAGETVLAEFGPAAETIEDFRKG